MPQTTEAPVEASVQIPVQTAKCDRRSLRSQQALRDALAAMINEGEELSRISVAGLTERAGLTRRTFYTHYKDIPDFVDQVEAALLDDIAELIRNIAATTLDEVYERIEELEPCPGSVELLQYFLDNREIIGALVSPGGDPAFSQKITDIARNEVSGRMQTGIYQGALGTFFDYYLTYVVGAETAVVQRWFQNGLKETPEVMARVMTVLAFVRPGDLYGKPIDINVPAYGIALSSITKSTTEEAE